MSTTGRRAVTTVLAVGAAVAVATGCTRTVEDATPTPAALAAPITALQVADLLGPKVLGGEGNLFVTVDPEPCSGLAREVDPPFIGAHHPLATDGGHWTTDDGAVFVEEMVAVYRFDFDPAAALADARATVESCRGTTLTVTSMGQRTYRFEVGPPSGGAPQNSIVWSLRAPDWNCDNTLVAAHNAAIEITACGAAGGFDVAALAEDALQRIEALANTTA